MDPQADMPLTPAEIMTHLLDDGSTVQRLAHRKRQLPMVMMEPDPTWADQFQRLRASLSTALGDTALEIAHAGSTSVPGLSAKNVIDIDLTVRDIHDEAAYSGPIESLGYLWLFREPGWHEHRFFVLEESEANATPVNLHVFGPACPEVVRHRIFRDWLCDHPEDRDLYAAAKRAAAVKTMAAGGDMMAYTANKEDVIREILGRAFKAKGWV